MASFFRCLPRAGPRHGPHRAAHAREAGCGAIGPSFHAAPPVSEARRRSRPRRQRSFVLIIPHAAPPANRCEPKSPANGGTGQMPEGQPRCLPEGSKLQTGTAAHRPGPRPSPGAFLHIKSRRTKRRPPARVLWNCAVWDFTAPGRPNHAASAHQAQTGRSSLRSDQW